MVLDHEEPSGYLSGVRRNTRFRLDGAACGHGRNAMCRVERGTKEQKRIEAVHSPHGRNLVPEEPDVDLDCDEHEHQTGPPGRPPNLVRTTR
jgi:hypothetical protein